MRVLKFVSVGARFTYEETKIAYNCPHITRDIEVWNDKKDEEEKGVKISISMFAWKHAPRSISYIVYKPVKNFWVV